MAEELAEEKHDRRAARGRRSRRLTHGARGLGGARSTWARGLRGTYDLGGARSSQPAWSSWHRQWRVLRRAAALGSVVGELEIPGRHGAFNRHVAAAATRATCCCLPWMAVDSERDSANGK